MEGWRDHSSWVSAQRAPTGRRADSTLGKIRIGFSRRRTSWTNRSIMFVVRSRLRYLPGRASAAGRLVEAVFKHLKGRRGLLRKFFSKVFEPILRLLLGKGPEDLIQDLVHPVFVGGRRLVHHVALEVCLTALPDQARERLPQGLLESFVCIAGGRLYAGESSLFELVDEPLPGRPSARPGRPGSGSSTSSKSEDSPA